MAGSGERSEDRVWARAMALWGDEIEQLELDHWWYAGRRAVIVGALRRHLPAGSRLLDFGCGGGALTGELARWFDVLGVDSSDVALDVARKRGVRVQAVSAEGALPGGFDAAAAFDVLEHIDDDLGAARRLAAAVRPGGLVAITVPAYSGLWGSMDVVAGHRRRYRLRGLTDLMTRARVIRTHASYYNSVLFPVIAAARLVGLPREGHEVDRPPRVINRLLTVLFTSEAPIASRLTIPFGTSILYLGRAEA